MFSVIQVNRIYLIFNLVHFLVDSSVIVTLIHEHERDVILRIEPPIAQPRPKAIVAVDSLYLLVVCRF